jgi:hypothetical protein
MTRRYRFLILVIFICRMSFAQNVGWIINGTVLDAFDKPIQFATVYINNTSVNTATDKQGNYGLVVPAQYTRIELIASFVGYKAQMKPVAARPGQKLQVVFKLDLANLSREVVVKGKRDKHWRRKWRIFEEGLLGESPFVRHCKILNPEVVKLSYDENTGLVVAVSEEPILILNGALGYQIRFEMNKFESNGKKTFISGYKFFEDLPGQDAGILKKKLRNRHEAYNDSFRNFLVLLSRNKLEDSHFEVFRMTSIREFYLTKIPLEQEVSSGRFTRVAADSICFYDKEKDQFLLVSKTPLIIFLKNSFHSGSVFSDYPFQYSQIVLPNRYAAFSGNGWLVRPNGITIHDFWAKEGLSSLLPTNYAVITVDVLTLVNPLAVIRQPKEDVAPVLKLPEIETQQIVLNKEGMVRMEGTEGNMLVKPDYLIALTESDNSYSVFDLLKRIPGLRVTFNAFTNTYKVYFIENNTNINADRSYDNTVALLLDNVFYSGSETVLGMLNSLAVRDIRSIGAIRYGNGAAFGTRGGNGTVVISTNK